mmetsp:Transcript_19288/g.53803  ORF Transcript_19288/g.53803 Transcript_19288/m.53803 type:complete len:115 (-) Transcript_19288:226-570(-)
MGHHHVRTVDWELSKISRYSSRYSAPMIPVSNILSTSPITIETGPVCGSEELRNNIEFVMTAVRTQNGLSLKLASEEPRRKDKKIVMTAVTQNGLCLILASEELVRNTRLSWLQ